MDAFVVEPRVVARLRQQLVLGDFHVGQPRRLGHAVRDVDAKPVDTAVQPEPQRLLQVVEHLGVIPVEVRLRGVEQVQVPLAGGTCRLGHPGPGRPAEHRDPVVRRQRAAAAAPIAEDVALALGGTGPGGQCGLKPRVLRAGVVGDEIHRHLDVALVGGDDQRVQCVETAEEGIDITGVGDVIAVVDHRRHGDRVEPDRVDAEQRRGSRAWPRRRPVADAVAVAVRERPRIHLIEHRA